MWSSCCVFLDSAKFLSSADQNHCGLEIQESCAEQEAVIEASREREREGGGAGLLSKGLFFSNENKVVQTGWIEVLSGGKTEESQEPKQTQAFNKSRT